MGSRWRNYGLACLTSYPRLNIIIYAYIQYVLLTKKFILSKLLKKASAQIKGTFNAQTV